MKTIFYRCESSAARQKAKELGIPYPGRERLHMVHVADGPLSTMRATDLLNAVKEESDFFWGKVEMLLEGKGL